MTETLHNIISIDLPPLLAAICASLTCGLLGNFLVLRRQSLMGDAISHAVLPGLVVAFLLSGTRDVATMFIGATISGLTTVTLVEVIKKYARVEPGAAMGVIFSILFAVGVLLIETAASRNVDLDADCLLYGQVESLFWLPPRSWQEFLSLSTLSLLPQQVTVLVVTLIITILFIAVFFKELRITAFDPGLANALGFNSTLLHYLFMLLVAVATVASFEAVGSILVIAMLICPAATARLLTDRLETQVYLSAVISVIAGVGGYCAATLIPAAFNFDAVSISGSMVVVTGLLLAISIFFSPSHGIVARMVRHKRLSKTIALDDLLATLFRLKESDVEQVELSKLQTLLSDEELNRTIGMGISKGYLAQNGTRISLSPSGNKMAEEIVRRHRLWESYLHSEANVAVGDLHRSAEKLEHLTIAPEQGPETDPHGREIPKLQSSITTERTENTETRPTPRTDERD